MIGDWIHNEKVGNFKASDFSIRDIVNNIAIVPQNIHVVVVVVVEVKKYNVGGYPIVCKGMERVWYIVRVSYSYQEGGRLALPRDSVVIRGNNKKRGIMQ